MKNEVSSYDGSLDYELLPDSVFLLDDVDDDCLVLAKREQQVIRSVIDRDVVTILCVIAAVALLSFVGIGALSLAKIASTLSVVEFVEIVQE